AVQRNPIPFLKHLSLCPHLMCSFFDSDFASTCHAALTHSASNDSRVTRHASSGSKNANGDLHAVYVLGRGFAANQDHRILLRAVSYHLDSIIGGKRYLADDCSW